MTAPSVKKKTEVLNKQYNYAVIIKWPVDLRHPALIYFVEKAFQPELADPKHQLISQISELLCICFTFQHRKKDDWSSTFTFLTSDRFQLDTRYYTQIETLFYFRFTSDMFASLL